MNSSTTERTILLNGMCMILAGLLWGLAIPQTPFPRIALSAHIQYEVNGVLFIVLALILIAAKPGITRFSGMAMLTATWLTWPMLLAASANAWWGPFDWDDNDYYNDNRHHGYGRGYSNGYGDGYGDGDGEVDGDFDTTFSFNMSGSGRGRGHGRGHGARA